MAYELKRLQSRHHLILDLLLEGKTQAEIARKMGYSDYGLSNVINCSIFKAELERRRTERHNYMYEAEVRYNRSAREKLDDAAVKAAETQVELLRSENPKIKQMSAMDILDRTGYSKVSRNESTSRSVQLVLTPEYLERMRQASIAAFGKEWPTDEDLENMSR